jgi:2-dehydropantoate 2-reductase
MRIAVVGAGGTGGYFGALLARSGEDVTLVARGAHLEAIRAKGLAVRSSLRGDFEVAPRATNDPAEVGPVGLVLFCVKSYDTDAATLQIRPMIGPDTVVLPLQNGIDSAERLARIVDERAVIGGLAAVSAVIEAPGVISHRAGPDVIRFGELAGGSSPRTEALLPVLRKAGIKAELHPEIRVALWEKFVLICGLSGLTALTRLPIGSILACPDTRELLGRTMDEVAAVARACGVALPPDCVDRTVAFFDAANPAIRGSLHYDLVAGRRLEIDTLNGAVVRLGRAHGVPTPLNFAIFAALRPYADGPPAEPSAG